MHAMVLTGWGGGGYTQYKLRIEMFNYSDIRNIKSTFFLNIPINITPGIKQSPQLSPIPPFILPPFAREIQPGKRSGFCIRYLMKKHVCFKIFTCRIKIYTFLYSEKKTQLILLLLGSFEVTLMCLYALYQRGLYFLSRVSFYCGTEAFPLKMLKL